MIVHGISCHSAQVEPALSTEPSDDTAVAGQRPLRNTTDTRRPYDAKHRFHPPEQHDGHHRYRQELWSYLTGKGATIEYSFTDMSVEVPKTTGPDAQRATWTLNGTIRIKTTDKDSAGSLGGV